jgi:hypothetical protein
MRALRGNWPPLQPVELLLSRLAPTWLTCESGDFGRHDHPRQVRAWHRSILQPSHARIPERVAENMVPSEERCRRATPCVHG